MEKNNISEEIKAKKREELISSVTVGTFVLLSISVSLISTIHAYDFFILTNTNMMSIFLSITFEIGQLAALAAIVVNNRLDMRIVWPMMIFLTLYQVMNNIYYSYAHMGEDYTIWSEMFGFRYMEEIGQKRLVAIISGAFLPLLALGFTKSLVDYLKNKKTKLETNTPEPVIDNTNIPIPDNIPENVVEDDYKNLENVDNSTLTKLPYYVNTNKSSDKYNIMLQDKDIIQKINSFNLDELKTIPDDKKLEIIFKTPRLLSLVYNKYKQQ